MKYEDFKKELHRQIGLNAKFFKPKEVQVLYDFMETMNQDNFSFEREDYVLKSYVESFIIHFEVYWRNQHEKNKHISIPEELFDNLKELTAETELPPNPKS